MELTTIVCAILIRSGAEVVILEMNDLIQQGELYTILCYNIGTHPLLGFSGTNPGKLT